MCLSVAALAAAGLTVASTPLATPAFAAGGGPVVLDGMDPVCHATMGENTGGYIRAVLAGLHSNVTRTNDGSIAVLGVDAATGSCGATFGAAMGGFTGAITPSPTVSYYPDAASITALFDGIDAGTATPAVLWLPDGSYAADATVTTRAQDLADFVAEGGGLFSNYSTYGWLQVLLPGATFNQGGCNGGPAVTADGTAAFPSLTDALVTACWHGFFTGDIGSLKTLVDWPYPTPSDNRVGVAIGGVQVTIGATAADAPMIGASAGNGQATVTVTAPASDGGAPITSYTVTAQPGGTTATINGATGGATTFTGLTNGVAYTFTATATNSVGDSSASAPAYATPVAAPDAPSITKAVAGNGTVSVTVAAPQLDGGSPVTTYTVTAAPGGKTATINGATGGATTFDGLTNGTDYAFTATAANAAGTSSASQPVSATPRTVPAAPSLSGVTTAPGQLSVTLVPSASNGGSAITGYTVRLIPGGASQQLTGAAGGTLTFADLANGTTYTLSATATNVAGDSAASPAVTGTPTAPATLPTPVTAPASPSAKAGTRTATSVRLRLAAPADDGGATIEQYQLTLTAPGLPNRVLKLSSPQAVTVNGLRPGTTYTVTVTSTNSAGKSQAHTMTFSTAKAPRGGVSITQLEGKPIASKVTMRLTGDGLFDYRSAKLSQRAKKQLRGVVSGLRPAKQVTCTGFTDFKGVKAANKRLGLKRAKAVCAFLEKHGVSATLRTRSKGEVQPLSHGDLRSERKVNRRVEIRYDR